METVYILEPAYYLSPKVRKSQILVGVDSNGKVGLNGVSFLAISQFHVAACQAYGGPPPSLCCISPWEGPTDPYRDIFAFGGLSDNGFPTFGWATEVKPINGTEEDFVKSDGSIPTDFLKNHPF